MHTGSVLFIPSERSSIPNRFLKLSALATAPTI
uniref:Uncharacterized protein n=1 Tax=Anguilla anguilla TaxID=7936 RepID=A0A0E9WD55_ANGAN